MGRPRKFPRHAQPQAEAGAEPVVVAGLDQDPVGLEPAEFDFDILDLMSWDPSLPSATEAAPLPFLPKAADAVVDQTPLAQPSNATRPFAMGIGTLGNHINFDAVPPEKSTLVTEISLEEAAQLMHAADLSDSVPGMSPNSATTAESQGAPTPDSAQQTAVCSCLPTLYLALDGLQTAPTEIGQALRVARAAARAAHDAILCPVCSAPPITDLEHSPPIKSFQTMMMIGAVLPTTANHYMRILDMADRQAAAADAARQTIRFHLPDYGGVWGSLADPAQDCGMLAKLCDNTMDPATWRLAVRALLRCDVYGVERQDPGIEFYQLGLKQIIQMMEDRSRERHAKIDELVACKLIRPPCGIHHSPGEGHTCMRIIQIAKQSMDRLVIA
jgi:hypothetical protein